MRRVLRTEHRYVEHPSGKIVGEVVCDGSTYDPGAEWGAFLRGAKVPHIGDYVTESLAKKAVEAAVHAARAKQPKSKRRA
jgi:hypothetical protein